MSTHSRRLPGRGSTPALDARVVVQWSIIGLTLVATAWLAYRPSVRMVPIPIIAVAVWLVLRYPGLGPLAVLFSLLATQLTIGTGTQTSLHAAIILIPLFVVLWLAKMLYRRWFVLAPSPGNVPLLALAGVVVLSFIAGNVPWLAFAQTAPLRTQLGGVATFLISAGAFLLAANEVPSLKWLKVLTWSFLGLASVYIAARAVPGLSVVLRVFPSSISGSLFWVWVVALAGGQLLFNHQLGLGRRLLCVVLVALVFVVGLAPSARDWASGWVPAGVCLALLIWLRWPRAALLVAVGTAIVVTLNWQVISGFVLGSDNEYSLFTRGAAWEIVLVIIGANPLLGVGPANYYWYTTLFPILGYYVNFNSHNQYLDVLAQAGLLGLGCLVWFVWATLRQGWRLRPRVSDGFGRGYVNAAVAGLLASLVAGMLGDWLIPFVYNVGISGMRASLLMWLFLGGMVALTRFVPAAASEAAPAP